MANVYAIRIHDLADDFRRRVSSFFEGTGGSYVVARETDASRAHFQGWVRCDLKDQALRARLKKSFPECVGNKGYSISKVKDEEAYGRYILKGTKEAIADVVCFHGLTVTEEFLMNEHRAYWSRAEKPSKSNRSMIEEVHEWTVEKMKEAHVSREDIARRICETLAARKKSISVFHVRGMTNTIEWLCDRDRQELILQEIVNKW